MIVSDATILNMIMIVIIDKSRGINYDIESIMIIAEWRHYMEHHSRGIIYKHHIFIL